MIPPPHTTIAGTRSVWCLAPDTALQTARGPVAARELCITDHLIDDTGRPIAVAGLWPLTTLPHAPDRSQRRSRPIAIQPGAIAPGIPSRPLLLPATTRGHIPGIGITALGDLTNGATIAHPPPSNAVSDWQGIACDGDATLLIADLAIPGFVLSPDDDIPTALSALAQPPTEPEPDFDLPAHASLAACRLAMADRALCLGHDRIADPGLRLRVEGQLLSPDCHAGWCQFRLPHPTHAPVTLLSRHAVPASLIGNREMRRLGVAISRIRAGARTIPLTHWTLTTGWHAPENTWRWTDGAATLRLPPNTVDLAIEIANTLPVYPLG